MTVRTRNCVYCRRRPRILGVQRYRTKDDSLTGTIGQMCRFALVRRMSGSPAQSARSVELNFRSKFRDAFPGSLKRKRRRRRRQRRHNGSNKTYTRHTEAPLPSLFFFSRATRRVHDEKHLLARRVHQSLSAGDDSVPAAVARRAGERESEAPLGESESMVGVTASAPIDARRCRPSDGRTLPLYISVLLLLIRLSFSHSQPALQHERAFYFSKPARRPTNM